MFTSNKNTFQAIAWSKEIVKVTLLVVEELFYEIGKMKKALNHYGYSQKIIREIIKWYGLQESHEQT